MVPSLSIDTPSQIDEALSVLSHRYRRSVLRYLTDESAPTALDDLTEYVREREAAAVRDGIPTAGHDEVLVALHHRHLPKLAATDAITYDSSARRVDDVSVSHDLFALFYAVEAVTNP